DMPSILARLAVTSRRRIWLALLAGLSAAACIDAPTPTSVKPLRPDGAPASYSLEVEYSLDPPPQLVDEVYGEPSDLCWSLKGPSGSTSTCGDMVFRPYFLANSIEIFAYGDPWEETTAHVIVVDPHTAVSVDCDPTEVQPGESVNCVATRPQEGGGT